MSKNWIDTIYQYANNTGEYIEGQIGSKRIGNGTKQRRTKWHHSCLLYTSDAADD